MHLASSGKTVLLAATSAGTADRCCRIRRPRPRQTCSSSSRPMATASMTPMTTARGSRQSSTRPYLVAARSSFRRLPSVELRSCSTGSVASTRTAHPGVAGVRRQPDGIGRPVNLSESSRGAGRRPSWRRRGPAQAYQQLCAFCTAKLKVISSVPDSRAVQESEPSIVISSSGMATGGRVLHHLVHGLPDARNTVLFAGYQAAGTRGRLLREGAKTTRIHGHDVPVAAGSSQ